jgi:hypothetical protein
VQKHRVFVVFLLPSYVNGCKFAMVNVNRNMNIVERSKNTIAPITYVPDVILYINGSPYVRYDGPHDIDSMKNFIIDINLKLKKTVFMDIEKMNKENPNVYQNQQQQQSSQYLPSIDSNTHPSQKTTNHPPILPKQVTIPAYTIGTPLYGERKKDKVCYLNFNNAYIAAKS